MYRYPSRTSESPSGIFRQSYWERLLSFLDLLSWKHKHLGLEKPRMKLQEMSRARRSGNSPDDIIWAPGSSNTQSPLHVNSFFSPTICSEAVGSIAPIPDLFTWVSCIAGRFFTVWDTRDALAQLTRSKKSHYFPILDSLNFLQAFVQMKQLLRQLEHASTWFIVFINFDQSQGERYQLGIT